MVPPPKLPKPSDSWPWPAFWSFFLLPGKKKYQGQGFKSYLNARIYSERKVITLRKRLLKDNTTYIELLIITLAKRG